MSATVRLHPDAERELAEAQEWYDQQLKGLGTEFYLCIEDAIARIQQDPESYPVVYSSARQILTKRFPYSIIYRPESKEIVIYSVLHGSRDPDVWKRRI